MRISCVTSCISLFVFCFSNFKNKNCFAQQQNINTISETICHSHQSLQGSVFFSKRFALVDLPARIILFFLSQQLQVWPQVEQVNVTEHVESGSHFCSSIVDFRNQVYIKFTHTDDKHTLEPTDTHQTSQPTILSIRGTEPVLDTNMWLWEHKK